MIGCHLLQAQKRKYETHFNLYINVFKSETWRCLQRIDRFHVEYTLKTLCHLNIWSSIMRFGCVGCKSCSMYSSSMWHIMKLKKKSLTTNEDLTKFRTKCKYIEHNSRTWWDVIEIYLCRSHIEPRRPWSVMGVYILEHTLK